MEYNNYSKGNKCLGCGKPVSNHAKRCYACFGLTQLGSHHIGHPISQEQRERISKSERLTKSGLTEKPSFICRICNVKTFCKPYEATVKKYCSKKCMYIGISKPQKLRRHFTTNKWYEIRRLVFERDGKKCFDCGQIDVNLAIHHIILFSRGGSDELSNLVALCPSCHRSVDHALQQTKVFGVINGNLSQVW